MPIHFATGPLTSKVSRAEAEKKLTSAKDFPKGAEYDLHEVEGRWVAAFHVAGPADAEEEAPGPKSEGPDDTTAPPFDKKDEPAEEKPEGDSDGDGDGDADDKPPFGEKGDGESKPGEGKGGDKLEHQIFDLISQIALALGIAPGAGAGNPLPGEEGPPPPPAPHPGAPHGGPPAGGPDQTVQHQRALKPGETPPGGTPIGAPAFSSLRDDHPWKGVVGKKASFTVEEKLTEGETLASINSELDALAKEAGYKVKQVRRDIDEDGDPVALALISKR